MRRVFIPSSEWLYFKLYTGHKSADDILSKFILPFIQSSFDLKLIDSFFFIRYSDPSPHIRLRLHFVDTNNYSTVFQLFNNTFLECIDNRLLSKIMCDTYQRELERYGSNTIQMTEQIFCSDSLAIIKLIANLSESGNDKEQERWLLSLRLIDDMLDTFDYNLSDKSIFFEHLSEIYRQEHGITGQPYSKQLNDKFRKYNYLIKQIFNREVASEYDLILFERKKAITTISKEILFLNKAHKLEATINNLLSSYIHMTMNRLFRSKNRAYEMVIYNFMDKYYKSEIARAKILLDKNNY